MSDVKNDVETKEESAPVVEKKATSLRALCRSSSDVVNRDAFKVSPSLIRVDPNFNLRGAEFGRDEYWKKPQVVERVEELAQAYTKNPLAVPAIEVKFSVADQCLYVRDGEHRYRGLMLAIERGADIKMVNVDEFKGDEVAETALLMQSAKTMHLSAVERAYGIYRLHSYGLTDAEISDKIGMSVSHIKQMLLVHNLPIDVKRRIQNEKLTVQKALAEVREIEVKSKKTKVPSKKFVVELSDVLNQFRDAEVVDGLVSVKIPQELFDKFIKNADAETDEASSESSAKNDDNGEFVFH